MIGNLHIAIYLPSLRGGGAERVMVTLANAFAAKGHRVDLVLVKAEGPYMAEVSAAVNIVDLGCQRVLSSFWPLVRYLRRARPASLLSALYHANLLAILARAAARTGTRLIVSERNSLNRRRPGRLTRHAMRRLYPFADGVVAVSRGIAQQLVADVGVPSHQVISIPNPVDIDRIVALSACRPPHPWLAEGEPPVILAVGRLEEQKDYFLLLDAFAKIRSESPVRLVILGEGSLRGALEQHIASSGLASSVILPGFQPNPFGWMGACTAYAMSSRHEGFPNSLVQALACGVPVVSTDCPTGPHEILEGGKWGRLVPVGDVDAFAEALREALHVPKGRDVSAMLQNFRESKIAKDYETLLT